MKHVKSESFLKSFLLFFLSLSLLTGMLFYFDYRAKIHDIDEKIFTEMKVCSFDLKCTDYTLDFTSLETDKLYKLTQTSTEIYSLFSIPSSDRYAIKLSLSKHKYEAKLNALQKSHLQRLFVIIALIAFLSFLFSWYTLHPLHKALKMTEEFSRDILHDFNTPLASVRLNVRMLQCPPSEIKKIDRIEQGIQTLISLQDNLRHYLDNHPMQKEEIELTELLRERVEILQKLYPDIQFTVAAHSQHLFANRDALTRILDNLLSNAAKYNRPSGHVKINLDPRNIVLTIQDTGKGIAFPKRVFERFYKENARGVGIGLHIVKKLCDSMNIAFSLESQIDMGTTVTLDLHLLTLR